jgi:hypothetical protein
MTQMRVQVEQLVKNCELLSRLYCARVPIHAPEGDNGTTFALACLARAHYTLNTIAAMRHRELDGATLFRTLYEHVVTFAWRMIDAREHFAMFQRWELDEREKLRKCLAQAGLELSSEDIRCALRDMSSRRAPETYDRALLADRYWSRLELGWSWHFQRSYENVFRAYGAHVHPTIMGLDCFITRNHGGGIVGSPRPAQGDCVVAEAALCFADGLAVASHRFGAPTLHELLDCLCYELLPLTDSPPPTE